MKFLKNFNFQNFSKKTVKPARLLSFIVSDVLGNDLSVIASGPTCYDSSTLDDAKAIAKKFNLPQKLNHDDVEEFFRQFQFKETPKDTSLFEDRVDNVLILHNGVALEAMRAKAVELGYQVKSIGNEVQGEARDVGAQLVSLLSAGVAVIGAGETTVTVRGSGHGGRNQELALGASIVPREQWPCTGVVASLGTDGADNGATAGGLVDNDSARRALDEKTIDAHALLQANDSAAFFDAIDECRLVTGPTGTNVADVMLALGDKQK